MMFEHARDGGSNCNRLHRVVLKIADHADIPGMRQFNQHREIWPPLPKRRMRGMPDALPTEDKTARFDVGPCEIKGVAAVAEPFGTELPALTTPAALHQQPVPA
jgi:hypothetical protein